MPIKRKLTAIMFTDIANFTSITSNNEELALDLLKKQKQYIFPIIEEFSGSIIKEMGDGLLITFNIVSDAVKCAIKIQKLTPQIDLLNLRIGIHEGEIAIIENDVLGDDVNIASRIEPFAEVGGIVISGRVQQNILSNPEYQTKYIGQPKLKGVKQEVKLFCITSHDLPFKSKIRNSIIKNKDLVQIFLSTILGILLFNYTIPMFQDGISKASILHNNNEKYKPTTHNEEVLKIFRKVEILKNDLQLESNFNAYNLLDELIITDSTQGDYYSLMGTILFQRFNLVSKHDFLDKSISNHEKAININNTNKKFKLESYLNLSKIYLIKNDVNNAYKNIKNGFQLDKNYSGIRKQLKIINRKRL